MAGKMIRYPVQVIFSLAWLIILCMTVQSGDLRLGTVTVRETAGLERDPEYVEFAVQLDSDTDISDETLIIAVDEKNSKETICQWYIRETYDNHSVKIISVIFPVNIKAYEKRQFILQKSVNESLPETNLKCSGEDLDLIVENEFYRADLTRSSQSEAKNDKSGQLRELLVKMNHNVLLHRTSNRMHWAPNFQKDGQESYQTIAGWNNPAKYRMVKGPYLIRTERSDRARGCPEINLSAVYSFYSGVPFFRFFSVMVVTEDVRLVLLRNDEMTMDSLFTHVAFQRPDGKIEDLPFSGRYDRLNERPLECDAPWLCFYHADEGYALGSIRIKYDVQNDRGYQSPLFNPHTKISNGGGGGKYWNRRLIDEHPVFVPRGSRYAEENIYLVFPVGGDKKFSRIRYWADRLRNPPDVGFIPVTR
jgi:hypothetical protein